MSTTGKKLFISNLKSIPSHRVCCTELKEPSSVLRNDAVGAVPLPRLTQIFCQPRNTVALIRGFDFHYQDIGHEFLHLRQAALQTCPDPED